MKKTTICILLLVMCFTVNCQEPVTEEPATQDLVQTTETVDEVQKEMTTEEALNNVTVAVSQFQGSWDEHLILRKSIMVLAEALGLYEQSE